VTEPEDIAEPENLSDVDISLESPRELERSFEPDGAKCDEILFALESETLSDCVGKLEIEYSRELVARSENRKFVEARNFRDSETEIDGKNKSETEHFGERPNKSE
jgi:hypothetical protein